MPLTENEALERARAYLKRISRELAYPVADAPSRVRRSNGAEPPHIQLEDGPVGSDFWAFEFPWRAPARIMVSPSVVRVFVDSATGAAALFSLK